VFAVPAAVVDRHIKLCSGVALKVLLLILRHPELPNGAADLAGRLNLPASDVADALNYWVESGVLLAGEEIRADPRSYAPRGGQKPGARPYAARAAPLPPVLSARGGGAHRRGGQGSGGLLHEAQSVMGKPFTSADLDALVGLYSYYGLSAHYILTLLHYCAAIGKRSMGYAEKVAASWMESGVDDGSVDRQSTCCCDGGPTRGGCRRRLASTTAIWCPRSAR
jgi:hypothetical protein